MKIVFIQTGGTIDKDYPKTSGGWAFEFGEPAVLRILERLNPPFDYEIMTAFQKDSLEITDEDREQLSQIISEMTADAFIITHGTDTMLKTARYLDKQLQNKLVILTGAMRPERFSNSDAGINLGSALGGVNLLSSGVYVTMHGVFKSADQMSRDDNTGKFH